jgi:hypothetical protein
MSVAVLLLASLAPAGHAGAQDGTLRIFVSTLNKYAAALQPLSVTRTWSFTLWIPVPNPFLLGLPTPVPIPFNCAATGFVTGIAFNIGEGSASVSGNVSGTVCGVAYLSTVASPVAMALDTTNNVITVHPAGPMLVHATVNFMGFSVTAPFSNVNVSPSLTGAIPVQATPVEIETPAGPRRLVLTMTNLQLALHSSFLEIQANAHFR